MSRTSTTASRKKPSISRIVRHAPEIPAVTRRVWILGCDRPRIDAAVGFLQKAGHDARGAEPGADVGATLRTVRPDLVVIDLASDGDRGKHVAVQLRADRATRQLPIVLVGVIRRRRLPSQLRRAMRPRNMSARASSWNGSHHPSTRVARSRAKSLSWSVRS